MVSKKDGAFVRGLAVKKNRLESGAFLVEGEKCLLEVLESDFEVKKVFCTTTFFEDYKNNHLASVEVEVVRQEELEKLGTLTSNNAGIAVVKMKTATRFVPSQQGWSLLLDRVNDPGNLGTILRIADWYGIADVVCSENTVDVYNPKVIAASKGSFTRVRVYYETLGDVIQRYPEIQAVGAELDGMSVHEYTFPARGFLVMGSESHGIDPLVRSQLTQKISIPSFGGAESLNVAIATAVLLDNLNRGRVERSR